MTGQEPRPRVTGGDAAMVIVGSLGLMAILGLLIHVLAVIATVIGALVMLGGSAYGWLRFRRWRERFRRALRGESPQPGHVPPVISLHIHGEVAPSTVHEITRSLDEAWPHDRRGES